MGRLFIISTPIGNLEDITLRAVKTLFSVKALLCEDTRKTGQLLKVLQERWPKSQAFYGMKSLALNKNKPKLISFHEHNEERRVFEILEILRKGEDVGLVSNSGTPLISDPGYRLVKACLEQNLRVVPIPGASAVLASLAAAGLPTNRFLFLGFLPEKGSKKLKLLRELTGPNVSAKTVILFTAPHDLLKTLEAISGVFGDIEIVLAWELTKLHENFEKGKAAELIEKYQEEKARGEIVLLFEVAETD